MDLPSTPTGNPIFPSLLLTFNVKSLLNMKEPLHGSRMVILLLTLGYFLNINPIISKALNGDVSSIIIEAKILKLISSMFLSSNIFWSGIHIFTVMTCGVFVEKNKGTALFLIFVLQSSLVSEIVTLIIYLSLYYWTYDTYYLDAPICGFSATIGAFSVTITQLLSENTYFGPLKSQYIPFVLMVCSLTLALLGIQKTEMCLIICGVYCSWVYLRYFENNNGRKGNLNDNFAFAALFPPIFRLPITALSNCTYTFFDNVGCCHQINNSNNNLSLNKRMITNNNLINNEVATPLSALAIEIQQSDPENAKKRQEAKNLIEIKLAELQKEVISRTKNMANKTSN